MEKFEPINSIKGVNVLNDRSSDEGSFNDNSSRISIRHAENMRNEKSAR